MVSKNVTLPYISFTLDENEADIVFFGAGVHDNINELYANKFIN